VFDLFGVAGRHWLSGQELAADERASVQALLRQLDFHAGELAIVDKELAGHALGDPTVTRLMTIPGVDAIAGISIVAAVRDFARFADPHRLAAYVGLNPKVRQSGNSALVHRQSARPAVPSSSAPWSRLPGQPAGHRDRYGRSTSGSRPAAGSRRLFSPPPAR